MTITSQEMEHALATAVRDALGITVVYGHQDAPMPDLPYAYVSTLGTRAPALDWTGPLADDGTRTTYGYRVRTMTVTIYGSDRGVRDHAERAMTAMGFAATQITLSRAGLGLVGIHPMVEIPEAPETGWLRRVAFDVELSYLAEETETVYIAREAQVTEEYRVTEDGDPVVTTQHTYILEVP